MRRCGSVNQCFYHASMEDATATKTRREFMKAGERIQTISEKFIQSGTNSGSKREAIIRIRPIFFYWTQLTNWLPIKIWINWFRAEFLAPLDERWLPCRAILVCIITQMLNSRHLTHRRRLPTRRKVL